MEEHAKWASAGLALALLLVPGCLEPFRAHVDPKVLDAELPWERQDQPATSAGWSGPKTAETTYTHRQGAGPPYPGILQVFSIRDLGRRATDELLDLARSLVEEGAEAQGIRSSHMDREGLRTLRSGLETHWFSMEGVVTSTGRPDQLFQQRDVRVRIIGEVGYDGRSATAILVVGIAQVEATQCTTPPAPLPRTCQEREDLRTWTQMVGDRSGTVRGAVSQNGLIDHLVTHA